MSPEASDALAAAWEGRQRPELLASHAGAEVYHCDWKALRDHVAALGGCDALIVDAPYSERTHSAYDDATRNDGSGLGDPASGRAVTRSINYAPWSPRDVASFVEAWSPIARSWFASLTDDVLAPVWRAELERVGRYAFQTIPIVEVGSRVRLIGDGPSSWSCFLVVARPRDGAWLTAWREARESQRKPRALPGAYVLQGRGDRGVMGGKRVECMTRILEDYSHPGDLIVDPCCGGGSTLLAAQRTNRRAIGGDAMREHAALAAKRVCLPAQQPLFGGW